MQTDHIAAVAANVHHPYRRWIEGSGLSMEANTESTPEQGVYYVFQQGVICFSSDDQDEAAEVFDRLRLCHWEELLASRDPQQRLEAARGLVRLNHSHVQALKILKVNGSEADRKRVTQAQGRARFALRRAG
jgi:hypothetical protein